MLINSVVSGAPITDASALSGTVFIPPSVPHPPIKEEKKPMEHWHYHYHNIR